MNQVVASTTGGRVVALCGGVGGAKLAFGLSQLLGVELTVVVNTGDDFEHLGLMISPDLDTVIYTLAGKANRDAGWGRADESWNFMDALRELGGETWFQLGDRDLALHVERKRGLASGASLTQVTRQLAARFGIAATILPMCDKPLRTVLQTSEGKLAFQRYFVERRCAPAVQAIAFEGADTAKSSPEVFAAFERPDLRAVIICPSNPFLSIDPILSVPGMRGLLAAARGPVVAVSPIIAGVAVKGPTAKIMAELGVPASSSAIVAHYGDFLDGLVIDERDAAEAAGLAIPVHVAPTLMTSDEDRVGLAATVLHFADRLGGDKRSGSAGP